MKRLLRLLWLLATTGGLIIGCVSPKSSMEEKQQQLVSSKPVNLKIFYTANRQGEIEPCGCIVNQMGGLDRLGEFLSRSQPHYLFVDSGDTFFRGSFLTDKEKRKAQLIAESYRLMKLSAISPGVRDMAAGWDFLIDLIQKSGAIWVMTNGVFEGESSPFVHSWVWEKNGLKIGILGVVDEKGFTGVPGLTLQSPESSVREGIAELKEQGVDRIILLSGLGQDRDQELGRQVAGLDLIVSSRTLNPTQNPLKVGDALMVEAPLEGQQIGSLSWEGNLVHHVQVPLLKDFQNDSHPVALLLQQFRESESARASNEKIPLRTDVKPFVANPTRCANCHKKQFDFWEKTKHASAYLVLYPKKQHLNQDCVGCHTLSGFKGDSPELQDLMKWVFGTTHPKPLDSRLDPKRFKKLQQRFIQRTHFMERQGRLDQNFLNVQCEHCHGNRTDHLAGKGLGLVKSSIKIETCRTCHQPPNAKFIDEKEIKRVACPRM